MKTRITYLLGIEHPIVQGAMTWVSFPPLVAAVSNGGGLGILGAAFMSLEELRDSIREVKSLTQMPYGVNFAANNPLIDELLDAIVGEKVPVVSYGIGNPRRIIERTKRHGIVNMPTVGSLNFTGVRCRVIRNEFSENLIKMAEQKAPPWEILKAGVGKIKAAYVDGDIKGGSLACGQACGLINNIPTCRELIEEIIRQAEEQLWEVQTKVAG